MSRPPTGAELRDLDLFSELTDEQLEPWAAAAELAGVSRRHDGRRAGSGSPGVTLLLEGTIEALVSDGNQLESVGDHVAPTWIGATAALTGGPLGVSMRASTDVRVAPIARGRFRRAGDRVPLCLPPGDGQGQTGDRAHHRIEQNRERLTSLGTMAAGLAHELNNPASAARRSLGDLAEALEVLSSTIGLFVESGLERDDAARLVDAAARGARAGAGRSAVAALDAADAEDELRDALEDAGSPRLADHRAARRRRGRSVLRAAGPPARRARHRRDDEVDRRLTVGARAGRRELAESTDRMSKLVAAIKSYAYMDRGGMVEVDLREGLETTLTILGHKLKHTQIEVGARLRRRRCPG